MPDKEIHIIRLMMTIIGRLKILFGAIFVFWGLWAYAFEEQAKYTSEYKSYLMKDFSTMAMMEVRSIESRSDELRYRAVQMRLFVTTHYHF